jgi:hypothetical protein
MEKEKTGSKEKARFLRENPGIEKERCAYCKGKIEELPYSIYTDEKTGKKTFWHGTMTQCKAYLKT